MNRLFLIAAMGFASPLFAADAPKLVWQLAEGLDAPESAHYDPVSDRIYVSNVSGVPTAPDGKGWISVVKTDGTLEKAKWISGLNAPKGLRIHDKKLWVSDIDSVVAYDVKTARELHRYKIEGAKFLNDIAIATDGTVYVSDMLTDNIHQIAGGAVNVLVTDAKIVGPNGLYVHDGNLFVATWGETMAPDFSTKTPGRIYRIDRTSGKVWTVSKPVGNLDGLERRQGNKGWLLSDWIAGSVFTFDVKGEDPKQILTGLKAAADIGYIARLDLLLIPEMNGNLLSAYKL